jgi:hypothetical protein
MIAFHSISPPFSFFGETRGGTGSREKSIGGAVPFQPHALAEGIGDRQSLPERFPAGSVAVPLTH